MFRTATIILCVLFLAGCALKVRTDYSKFDSLPPNPSGKTVFFVPVGGQQGSAAYEAYATKVSQYLAQHGMTRTRDWNEADYAVVITYGVSGQRTVTGSTPIIGQTGGGTTTYSGTTRTYGSGYATGYNTTGTYTGTAYTAPTYGITGYIPYSRTETDRFFTIRMVDIKASTDKNWVPAYEGSVLSSGSSKSFDLVADCMMQSLFDNFRGTGSAHVDLVMEECK